MKNFVTTLLAALCVGCLGLGVLLSLFGEYEGAKYSLACCIILGCASTITNILGMKD